MSNLCGAAGSDPEERACAALRDKGRTPKAQKEGAGLKERSSVLWSHDGIPRRPGLGGPARVTYLLLPASLGVALHPGLRKPAASLARGLRKSLPRPTRSAQQLRIPATAAGSKCADGPLGWRRLAGPRRPQPLGCCVPAGECNPRARGTPAFTPCPIGRFPELSPQPLHS